MSISSFPAETRLNERIFRLTSYALVGLMMACAAHTFSVLVGQIILDWPEALLPVLVGFIAFERLFTLPRTRGLLIFSTEWLRAVLLEWIALAFILRVAVGLAHGLDAFVSQLFVLTYSVLEFFLLPEYIFTLVVSLLAWMLTGYFAGLLDEMGLDRALIAMDVPLLEANIPHPRARLAALVFSLGSALVVFTALVRVNLREIFTTGAQPAFLDLPAMSGGGGSTLLYFLLGLALLSQGQFITLHTQWSLARVRVAPGVVRSWLGYSLAFFALVVALAALLPTSYSLGFFALLGVVLDFIFRVVGFLAQLLIVLVVLLFNLPGLLFGRQPEDTSPPPAMPDVPEFAPRPMDPTGAGSLPWLDTLRDLFSWGLLLVIIGFALLTFLRQHGELGQSIARFPLGRWLVRFWRWLGEAFKAAGDGVTRAVDAGLARLRARRAAGGVSAGWMSLRRLDPRQKVRFFYLALIRRGGERGLTRGPAQTPLEYAATLEQALPDADTDIAALTDEFIKARYSRQPVPEDEATFVRRLWERVHKALRNKPQ